MPKVVLVHPEIPPNTGNIARTCAATKTELHLVQPLGFELSDRYLKRAGLDYWPYVDLHLHDSWQLFLKTARQTGTALIGFSTSGTKSYVDIVYHHDDWLIFGKETAGLTQEMLAACDVTVRIPMAQPSVRSLNLSSSVAIGLFESLRQTYL
ncbi:tRNA (uridine(34)/cytosine(34)/5-carboxymethylaminomethyluridine(34)-2'-O)-methyltransferase TrmL [Oscillatoria sp. CS-180]|uniref:tRNA (uridine(34)/cytosine(34)/5- carboxymethylaminomethyluridine(34)-2'-O)- methyltransferase TrmL n=1 Tax=Oscillatoria sp. CS-180 TaxID=3021720 RepID=UPI00232F5AA1|nr:tRNA (uridine(34)/cytosine(34)/5-carboxymethylaminomethyluridine(34)-2'-O)-methyltransferase TrmL [Oscillatoria sp. CS-180]MDB9524911.1 tRNA (uridine(34)/cytosine(34)/5-carboxymethylaminomethyluridine(34)-2'-O)-methyltransferase TrmL [Oscillatoria sp. CS-180]